MMAVSASDHGFNTETYVVSGVYGNLTWYGIMAVLKGMTQKEVAAISALGYCESTIIMGRTVKRVF
jgi:hypothetical protein